MQVSVSNDVKVYNLSGGKALPEWISDRKRRKLEQQDVDIRRRIQLMQDCQMPCASHTVCFSPDGRYLFATGTYKPFLKCFDVDELSLKFERGLDADVLKMVVLSDDYSKLALLEEERYLELHTHYGRHMRLRIPHFGRDMVFCRENGELLIVGCHSEVFRLSLEEGRFHEPLKSDARSLTCCQISDEHQLLVVGTDEGKVEAWDYRDRRRVATLDCIRNNNIALEFDMDHPNMPEVSCVQFKDALHLGVGLGTGHVLLYDIRSTKPRLIKDHRMGLPIKRIEFLPQQELVLSMDPRVLKIWQEPDGQPFTSVEPGMELKDFCRFPNSGLLFFANDAPKMQQFFIPSLGSAPKWCSHLESITEELEQTERPGIYDDYKFVTKAQLEELGLESLIGTSMLRAYMHGYFMSAGLYEKARSANQPIAYELYKKRKLQKKLDEERSMHVIRKQSGAALPKVNRELAERLHLEKMSIDGDEEMPSPKAKPNTAGTILTDERFKKLFDDEDFEIDPELDQLKEDAARKRLEKKSKSLNKNKKKR